MIPLEITYAVTLYGGILLGLAVAIWAITEAGTWRKQRTLGKQYLWRCFFCAFSYLDEEAEDLSRCPRCGSLNSSSDKNTREVGPTMARQREDAEPTSSDGTGRRNPSLRKRHHQRRRGPRKR